MRAAPGCSARPVLIVAVLLLASLTATRAQSQGGSLSGVVLPDLPPEVSPGEEISFTPPAGSETGTWTLSGVVAEEEPLEEPPATLPEAVRMALRPTPGMPALSEAQRAALALAAAIEQAPWEACVSGRPAGDGAARARKAGEPLPDVDVALEKKPGPQNAIRMVLSELSPEQVSGLKAARPAKTHQDAQYFGAQLESLGDAGEPAYKSFFESRSNTANHVQPSDPVLYSLARPGGSKQAVEVTSGDHLFDAAVPPVVVAFGASADDPKKVALTPVQCAHRPAETPLPQPVKVGLNLPEGGEPWTDEHLVGLAVAAVIEDGSWAQCANPAAMATQKAGDGIGGVEVGIRKKPGRGSSLALKVLVSESKSLEERVVAESVREAVGTELAVRYWGVDAAPSGCATCKSFYESRSNVAKLVTDSGDYSIAVPGGAQTEVEVTGMADTGGNAPPPSMVVAASVSRPKGRKAARQVSVDLAAAQCVESPARSFWPKPDHRPPSKPNLRFKVPETLKPGEALSVIYRDPSGKVLLDVPAAPGVTVVPPRPVSPRPSLDAAPEHAIAGRPVCVCGNFPDARSRHGFLFDEQAVGTLSASSHMAILPLAETVRPGRHPISASPDAGFSANAVVYTTVINVNGKLDASLLRRGQATQMELAIDGTDKPVALRVVNKTPDVISIGGRTDQVLTTTGGNPNRVVQKVDSVRAGNFNIEFSLAADRCPCQSGSTESR